MHAGRSVTFVVAVNNSEIFESNFLASPCLGISHNHQILVQKDFVSAAKAYNSAIVRSANDLMVFAHQDIILPERWLSQLEHSLVRLQEIDPQWGVCGCYGETANREGRGYVFDIGIMGEPFEDPAPVQTLDEIVLILRKSSGLRFDESLPHFHLYGADICMTAAQQGMKSYAISALCIHNSGQSFVLPKEFYEGYKYFREKWKDCLPVQTTCITITRFNLPLYRRKLNELYLRYIARKTVRRIRANNPHGLLAQCKLTRP
jgi:hypothetical protein